ncbi:MAG: alpha/beta fold hydrolase [Ilumatobacteraceae bacterium]
MRYWSAMARAGSHSTRSGDLRTRAAAHYFGRPDRSRFGMVHWPSGAIHGSVVVCPPIGYESVGAHRSLRRLAEDLCQRGFVVLRFDYDGTGNSVGLPNDPLRLQAWRDSLRDAVDEICSLHDSLPVLVGLRFGAALAAQCVAEGLACRSLVLWDPVLDRRRYSRSLKLLAATGDESSSTTEVSVGGIPFTLETLAEIAAFKASLEGLNCRGLLIERSEQVIAQTASPDGWDTVALPGTSGLLDTDAELAVVPDDILAVIQGWIISHAGEPSAERVAPTLRSTCTEPVGERSLVHTAGRVGQASLFCIETVEAGCAPRAAVLMLNNGVAQAIGPGRSWIELAQLLALDGYHVLRLDLSGLGESAARPGRSENDPYPVMAGEDIADTVDHVSARHMERIACLGLCSGAQLSFDAATRTSAIDVIMSINGRFDMPFHDKRTDRQRRAARQTFGLAAVPLRKTRLLPTIERLPSWVWSLLDKMHVVGLPTHPLRRYRQGKGSTLLVFGPDELGLRALRGRATQEFDGIINDDRVKLSVIPQLDHSMFNLGARTAVFEAVREYLETAMPTSRPCSADGPLGADSADGHAGHTMR